MHKAYISLFSPNLLSHNGLLPFGLHPFDLLRIWHSRPDAQNSHFPYHDLNPIPNPPPPPRGGGGGTSILTVTGTCPWTGYIFTVIHIGTAYLNRPNWLLAGYSVYHSVASRLPSPQCLWQARNLGTSDGACGTTLFMTGPRSPRSGTSDGARGTQQIFMNVWWYTAE